MTDEEMTRLERALTKKWASLPREDVSLQYVIGTTIADTLLVTEGALTVEDFEQNTLRAACLDGDWDWGFLEREAPRKRHWWQR